MTPKTRTLAALLLLAAFSGACAKAQLTLRNERSTPIRQVKFIAGGYSYELPELAAGASHVTIVEVPAAADVQVNYTTDQGLQNFSSSPLRLNKGEGRKLLFKVQENGSLAAEAEK